MREKIGGRHVATFMVEKSCYSDPSDHVEVYRCPDGWVVLTLGRHVRWDDDLDEPVTVEAYMSVDRPADVAALEDHFRNAGWRELLDEAHSDDPELYAAWVPQQVDADLNASSIYSKDLAKASSFLCGTPLPAAGRALPGWEADALGTMVANLEDKGWVVRARLPVPSGGVVGHDPVLGVVVAWRYGWAVAIVVRVDECGEIFARRADDGMVSVGAALRPLSGEEEDLADAEYHRRRAERAR